MDERKFVHCLTRIQHSIRRSRVRNDRSMVLSVTCQRNNLSGKNAGPIAWYFDRATHLIVIKSIRKLNRGRTSHDISPSRKVKLIEISSEWTFEDSSTGPITIMNNRERVLNSNSISQDDKPYQLMSLKFKSKMAISILIAPTWGFLVFIVMTSIKTRVPAISRDVE